MKEKLIFIHFLFHYCKWKCELHFMNINKSFCENGKLWKNMWVGVVVGEWNCLSFMSKCGRIERMKNPEFSLKLTVVQEKHSFPLVCFSFHELVFSRATRLLSIFRGNCWNKELHERMWNASLVCLTFC